MSAVLFSLLVLIITIVTWSYLKNKRRNELLSKIPSPRRLPLINHTGYFFNKSPEEMFNNLVKFSQEYGPVWCSQLPGATQIWIHDPKVLEFFLTSQKFISKSEDYEFLYPWMGTGLLTSTGQKWHQRRKIITPAFHFKILDEFVKIMETKSDIFINILKAFQGQEIDVYPNVSLYALDVICECAMGYELNAQTNSESEYVKAVKEMTHILFIRLFDAVKRNYITYRFTEMYKREQFLIKVLHEFTTKVINERKSHVRVSKTGFEKKQKLAFLDLLLQAKADGKPLDDEGIREEVDTFMFRGHDTTASGISFALLNLAKYPEIQQEVFEECRDVLGDKMSLTMHDLNQLSFLEKFIKESLRIFPSVPFIGRRIDEEISVGDYTFPKGVTINMAPFFLGRDPKIFANPLKFDPHRFNCDGDEKNIFSYIPFSAGPRNCIGQKFAMLEMKSILSKVVRNFEISVKKEHENPILMAQLVLKSKDGIV